MSKIFIKIDTDGKILSFKNSTCFNINLENISGKRIYNFFHSSSVIKFIKAFQACKDKFSGFFLVNLNNNIFQSEVFVKKDCDNIFYVTIVPKNNNQNISNNKDILYKLNFILRTKFVLGSMIPLLFSIFWSLNDINNFSFVMLFPLIVGAFFFHISANTFNDYFDWKSGRDKKNLDYVLFSTGGSRAIDFGLITEKKLLFLSIFCFFIVFICGLWITYVRGPIIFYIGLFGALAVYFYSAPPIHLASRYGAGELIHILCLGPLLVMGSKFTLLGYFNWLDFFIGLPFGLLITACLLMNEYPDSKYDKMVKKYNLAVLLGIKYIPYLFLFLVSLSYIIIIVSYFYGSLSFYFLFVLLTLPYFIKVALYVFKIREGRHYISSSCIGSFYLYVCFSLMMFISVFLNIVF